jgi:hypothetical protein
MDSFEEYGLDSPPSPVYSHSQVMQAFQNQIATIAQSSDHSGIISKLQSDNEKMSAQLNDLNSVKNENERLRAELGEVRKQLESTVSSVNTGFSNFNGQLISLNTMVTPVCNRYNTDREGQIQVLQQFFTLHYRHKPGAKAPARQFNEKVYVFSVKKGIPIPKTQVKELVTAPPFNLVQYKSTGGIACYRDLEEIQPNLQIQKQT